MWTQPGGSPASGASRATTPTAPGCRKSTPRIAASPRPSVVVVAVVGVAVVVVDGD